MILPFSRKTTQSPAAQLPSGLQQIGLGMHRARRYAQAHGRAGMHKVRNEAGMSLMFSRKTTQSPAAQLPSGLHTRSV